MESSEEVHFFPFFFYIALILLPIQLKTLSIGIRLQPKNKPQILYGQFKVICKNEDDLEGLQSIVKRFSGVEKQFGLHKCTKLTSRKDSLVKYKNITIDIKTEITELEHNKTNQILRNNEAKRISLTIIKEEIKEFYTRRQWHKNIESNIEQVLATTPHETPTIRPLASHHENYTI